MTRRRDAENIAHKEHLLEKLQEKKQGQQVSSCPDPTFSCLFFLSIQNLLSASDPVVLPGLTNMLMDECTTDKWF